MVPSFAPSPRATRSKSGSWAAALTRTVREEAAAERLLAALPLKAACWPRKHCIFFSLLFDQKTLLREILTVCDC